MGCAPSPPSRAKARTQRHGAQAPLKDSRSEPAEALRSRREAKRSVLERRLRSVPGSNSRTSGCSHPWLPGEAYGPRTHAARHVLPSYSSRRESPLRMTTSSRRSRRRTATRTPERFRTPGRSTDFTASPSLSAGGRFVGAFWADIAVCTDPRVGYVRPCPSHDETRCDPMLESVMDVRLAEVAANPSNRARVELRDARRAHAEISRDDAKLQTLDVVRGDDVALAHW
jgi:hypothetical protein